MIVDGKQAWTAGHFREAWEAAVIVVLLCEYELAPVSACPKLFDSCPPFQSLNFTQ